MSLGTKLGVLIVVGAGLLWARECDLLGSAPADATELAIKQLDQNGGESAAALRSSEAVKNWWTAGSVLALVALAFVLFADDVAKLWRQNKVEETSAHWSHTHNHAA